MGNEVNKILIITGGQVDDSFLNKQLDKEQYKLLIVADHGLMAADRLKLKPDFIVGDFDSVSPSVLDKYRNASTPIQTFPKEKDKTDTQIAIELALSKHATSIDIIGATGSRLHHALANIHLLLQPLKQKVHACIIDGNNKIYLRDNSFTLDMDKQYGNYVSLLPYGEKVSGLTLKGFLYPLDHIIYESGCSLGISNEIVEKEAFVEFEDGILIVIESMD
jgi:thiamine pyrophosphokinase